LIIYKYS